MSTALGIYRWWMPSARTFFANLVRRAEQGANTVVLLNDLTDPAELASQIAESFQQNGDMLPFTIDMSERPGIDPLVGMNYALHVRESYSIERLIQAGDQLSVFIVYGMDANPNNAAWAVLARNWAALPRGDARCNILIALCRFYGQPLPQPGDRFNYMKWNEEASALEMSMCCRLHGQANNISLSLQRWIEAMVSSLAPSDMTFAEQLWPVAGCANGILYNVMRSYAQQKGWKPEDAERILLDFPMFKRLPSNKLSEWWGRGWLTHVAEYNFELHSALLALIPDGEAIINGRIWRAQATLVLPAIDRLRNRLIAKANGFFPRDWKLSNITELGELENFLRGEDNGKPGLARLVEDTTLTRLVRNDLAHYKPIEFDRYRALLALDQD